MLKLATLHLVFRNIAKDKKAEVKWGLHGL